MSEIKIERNPGKEQLDELGVTGAKGDSVTFSRGTSCLQYIGLC